METDAHLTSCTFWRDHVMAPPSPECFFVKHSTLFNTGLPASLRLAGRRFLPCRLVFAILTFPKVTCWNSLHTYQPGDTWGAVNWKLSQLIYMFQVLIPSQFLNGLRRTVFSYIWQRLFLTWPIFHGSHLLYLVIIYMAFCIDFFSLSESTLGLLPKSWIWCSVTPLLFILQSGVFDNSFISSHDTNWQGII